MKIEFFDDDYFVVYYISNNVYEKENDYKVLFKYLNNELTKRYNYILAGFYDVTIYVNKGVYILEFNRLDYYEKSDFNVTIFLNSLMLYQFEDIDLVATDKIYYQNYFYTELDMIIDDIRLFEYGSIIYGKKVEEILNKGILLT